MTSLVRRGLRAVVAAIGIGLVAGLQASDLQQTPTFKVATDAVIVTVSVRDGLKVPQGLEPSDFELLDDGVRQPISDVTYGRVPVDVTVAIDVSASETGAPLARLKRGVLQLASDLAPGERLKLVAFNHHIRQVFDFTADRTAVTAAVTTLVASGGTSIFDALTTAMLAPADPARRQLITLFTDGDDGVSTTEPEELIEAGRRSAATVSLVIPRTSLATRVRTIGGRTIEAPQIVATAESVAPAPRRPEPAIAQDVRLLNELVTLTGGRVIVDAGPPSDLGPAFRAALEAFRTSYVLYFTPRGVDRAGFHTLKVRLPAHPRFTVTARSGYFGG